MKSVLIFSVFIFGIFMLPIASFGQMTNSQSHPLSSVTSPMPVGNGTVFQTIMIFNTKPVEDVGLAEYNKAVNFERVKSMIINSTFPDKMIKDIISDVEKQRSTLQSSGMNIIKYYTNGSMTLPYSKWWMQSYVVSRLDQDGLQTITSSLSPGETLHTAIDPIDREMQRIISNYNLNYSQTQQQPILNKITNFTTSNLTRNMPVSSPHQVILNITSKTITSIDATRNNHTTDTNMSEAIPTIPEFPFAIIIFVISTFFIILIYNSRKV